jgi:chromosome segregation ATPase
MANLTTQLDEARQTLQKLQEDLPRYHGLLTDSQATEATLQRQFREGSGKFSELTAAKTASMTARELLEQHQSDIGSARAEIGRLEVEVEKARKEKAYQDVLKDYRQLGDGMYEQLGKLVASIQTHAVDYADLEQKTYEALQKLDRAAAAAGVEQADINLTATKNRSTEKEPCQVSIGMRRLASPNKGGFRMGIEVVKY